MRIHETRIHAAITMAFLLAACLPVGAQDVDNLRLRLNDAGNAQGPLHTVWTQALLLWGGTDAEGEPFLNPAFVIDAPAVLPNAAGEHQITGRTGSGDELFSVDFAMPEVADGDGSSSFAFRAPGSAQLGRQPGEYHARWTRWIGHAGQRHRPSHGDPARSGQRTGEGHPARRAAGGGCGGARPSGG